MYKIAIVGTGKVSPIEDKEISEYLSSKNLNF